MNNETTVVLRLACCITIATLGGCDSGGRPNVAAQSASLLPSVPPAPPPVPLPLPPRRTSLPADADNAHAHFRGTATRGGESYHAEALLTERKELRVYLGGPVDVTNIETGAGVYAEVFDEAGVLTLYGAEPFTPDEARTLQLVAPHLAQMFAALEERPDTPARASGSRSALRIVASR